MTKLRIYLLSRINKLKERLPGPLYTIPSAYDHLNQYLSTHEDTVKRREATATTIDDLHQLRLEIKHWRYLLTEFFSLTNLQLVKTQQCLGKLNDLHRLSLLIGVGEKTNKAQDKLQQEYQRYLDEFNELRSQLPYSLRPNWISYQDS